MDARHEQLSGWISAQPLVTQQLGQDYEIGLLSGDASFRRYFRVRAKNHFLSTPSAEKTQSSVYGSVTPAIVANDSSIIAVDAPPKLEDNPRFVQILRFWEQHGISVPQLLASNFEQGFMLLSDLGDQQLLSLLNLENVESFYKDAFNHLIKIQTLPKQQGDLLLPNFDRVLITDELSLFSEWFVKSLLNFSQNDLEKIQYSSVSEYLIENAQGQPQVCVHRDYHSRNLMVLEDHSLCVIDFQDAVWGPVTYDLVSLLRDCYIQWPKELVKKNVLAFRAQAVDAGVNVGKNEQEFLVWFDLMGVQRHLKAVGIFARLWLRDRKSGYLQDIPRTLDYIVEVCSRYEVLSPFAKWLHCEVVPKYQVFHQNLGGAN